jgi:DNA repair exonuclease SbcCD ATPase subunit
VDQDQLERFQREAFTPPAVTAAIGKVLAARQELKGVETGIADELAALKEINEDQARIRANMAVTPKESEAYKRYLKKFDDQETEIEKRQANVKELTKTKDRKAKELAELIRTLKGE